jgi:hypothetical protein
MVVYWTGMASNLSQHKHPTADVWQQMHVGHQQKAQQQRIHVCMVQAAERIRPAAQASLEATQLM